MRAFICRIHIHMNIRDKRLSGAGGGAPYYHANLKGDGSGAEIVLLDELIFIPFPVVTIPSFVEPGNNIRSWGSLCTEDYFVYER